MTIRRKDLARADLDARSSPAATTPTPAETRPPRRRRRVGATLLVLLFLISIAAGAAFTWFEVGPGAQRVVPDLAGEPAGAAEDALAGLGLASATTSTFDEVVPVGTVVGTDPPAGGSVHKDGRVTLVLSSGPELFGVPTLAGSTAGEAGQALADAGLRLGAVAEVFDDQAAPGTVVSTDPAAGTELRSGTEVSVAVSRGPQPVAVPSVLGLSLDEATATLDGVGLTVGGEVTEVYDAAVPAGSVRSQDPGDGELLPGAEVVLEVSLGPEPVEVPRLFDARYDDAAAQLQALGFVVERRGSSLLNRVVEQDPDPGTLLVPGSTVTLTTF